MVKFIVLFFTLSTCITANAQVDTLKCKCRFTRYDKLLGENLIVLWETPPALKECSQKDVNSLKESVRDKLNYDYILVDIIVDSEGIPICFRFKQDIKSEFRAKLIEKLKLLRFKPALVKGNAVESIYTIKI